MALFYLVIVRGRAHSFDIGICTRACSVKRHANVFAAGIAKSISAGKLEGRVKRAALIGLVGGALLSALVYLEV